MELEPRDVQRAKATTIEQPSRHCMDACCYSCSEKRKAIDNDGPVENWEADTDEEESDSYPAD